MEIYIGADHAGYEFKKKLKEYLTNLGLGYEVEDMGAFTYDEDDDYPDFVRPVAEAVAKEAIDVQGEKSADLFEIVKIARVHNNANILSLGVRFLSEDEAKYATELFLKTEFKGEERHIRRINKLG